MERILWTFRRLRPRTFYATANVYRSLRLQEDLMDPSNILACTPTWDIDNTLQAWKATIVAAQEIHAFLEQNGITRSAFVKWSGKGCHVHVSQNAFSETLRSRVNPLDLAYAVVEYVNAKLREKFLEIALRYKAETLRVDNEMDFQRLFTCPLSLHREFDKVCVCIDPNDLDAFTPEWADVKAFRHDRNWDRGLVGEADELAKKAYEAIGPGPQPLRALPRVRRRQPPLDRQIARWVQKL